MSEILAAPERKGLLISEQDIPFSAYQAIYHKLTKKTETISREYKDPYQVKLSDLKNLDQRLNQLIAQYQVRGKRCEISHATKNGFSRTHSSFEMFEISDASARECTTSLNYQLDFLIVLPAQIPAAEDIPQRYKIDLYFEQEFFDDDDDQAPYFMRGFISIGSLKAKIEYADFAVAQALDAAISGWVNQLDKKKKSKLQSFLNTSESGIRQASGTLATASPFIGGAIYAAIRNLSLYDAAALVLGVFALSIFSSYVFQSLTSAFYTAFNKTIPCPRVLITQGDKDRCDRIEETSRKANVALGVLFVSCVVGFLINIFAAWVFERLI